jgi:hypothetical protein
MAEKVLFLYYISMSRILCLNRSAEENGMFESRRSNRRMVIIT